MSKKEFARAIVFDSLAYIKAGGKDTENANREFFKKATVLKRYRRADEYSHRGWLIDVVFDDSLDKISKGHLEFGVEYINDIPDPMILATIRMKHYETLE